MNGKLGKVQKKGNRGLYFLEQRFGQVQKMLSLSCDFLFFFVLDPHLCICTVWQRQCEWQHDGAVLLW
jgi:hypothetical protein